MTAAAPVRVSAPAKLTLSLQVLGTRPDGFHDLVALTVMLSAPSDTLTIGAAAPGVVELTVLGGDSDVPRGEQNLAVRAARALLPHDADAGVTIELNKVVPSGAGLGGGSADAGAVFRLYDQRFGLPDDWRDRAARLGADVPACVASRTCIGRGTGAELEPGPQDLAGTSVLLVNPRVPLATGPVFAGWDGVDHGPLPGGSAREIALAGRNDLQAPALALCPAIGDVLAALRGTDAWFVRMSGSGATCFALFNDPIARDTANAALHAARPDWWRLVGCLR